MKTLTAVLIMAFAGMAPAAPVDNMDWFGKRLDDHEKRIAALEKALTVPRSTLSKTDSPATCTCNCVDCKCTTTTVAKAANVPKPQVWQRVCNGGTCTMMLVDSPVQESTPFQSVESNGFTGTVCSGGQCTTCVNGQCTTQRRGLFGRWR